MAGRFSLRLLRTGRLMPVLSLVLAAGTGTAAHADCSRIESPPMAQRTPVQSGNGVVCEWRTELWAPVETCGAFGFEVTGAGAMPVSVIFKRSNTYYETVWEPKPEGAGWTSASLEPETSAQRCFAGWCRPLSYVLRTAGPVESSICAQEVQLKVRLEDRTE